MIPTIRGALAAACLGLASAATSALEAPMPIDGEQAWVYSRETLDKSQVVATERFEVSTAFQNRWGDWVTAVRSLETPVAEGDATRGVGIRAAVNGHGCVVDVLAGLTLQIAPCGALPAPGVAWSTPTRDNSRRELKVTGVETVHVPAGDFEALRVESAESLVFLAANGTRSNVPTYHVVYWYAPRVGAMARVERDILRPDGTVARRQREVLESFGAPSETSHDGVRATRQWQANEHAKAVHARIAAILAATPPDKPARIQANDAACKPEYPPAAIRAMAMGETRLVFIVGADGAVQDSEITGESGPTREHRLLDNAAQTFLARCPFSAAVAKDGTPVLSVLTISYVWKLE
jgi:hypothetical protein